MKFQLKGLIIKSDVLIFSLEVFFEQFFFKHGSFQTNPFRINPIIVTGAFAAGVPVQPIILKYQTAENEFNPSWESIRISTHFLRMLCQRSYKCTILVLSKIDPQKPFVSAIEKLEYVKSSRIIESEERKKLEGEVKLMAKEFACTVRDKMAKAGDLSMSNSTYQDKYQYHAALQQLGY